MNNVDKSVFISYRRSVSEGFAWAIAQDLEANGYDVFFDVKKLGSGEYESVIFNQISSRSHFLILLTPGSTERFLETTDLMRREIEAALFYKRNVIPILFNCFTFQICEHHLIGDLLLLRQLNALNIYHDYFEEGVLRLRNRFLQQPMYGHLTSASKEEEMIIQRAEKAAREDRTKEYRIKAQEYFESGQSKWIQRDLDGAIADCTSALELYPDFPEALNRRGSAYYYKREYDTALIDFNRAIAIDQTFARPYHNRALVYIQQGLLTAAMENLDEAIKLSPAFALSYEVRGKLHKRVGNIEECLRDFSTALELSPSDTDVLYARSQVLLEIHDYKGAIADCTSILELGATNLELLVNAHFIRASARFEQKDWDGVLEDSQYVLANIGEDDSQKLPRLYQIRGKAFWELEDWDGVIKAYTEMLKLTPNSTVYLFDRALAYENKGLREEAIADYQQYLDLGGGYEYGDQDAVEERIDDLSSELNLPPAIQDEQPLNLSFETVVNQWKEVLKFARNLDKPVEALLKTGQLARVSQAKIVLQMPSDLLAEKLIAPHNKEIVKKALKSVFKQELDFDTTVEIPKSKVKEDDLVSFAVQHLGGKIKSEYFKD